MARVCLIIALAVAFACPAPLLTEKYAKKPVIVMNYRKANKAFYMRFNDDGRTVAPMDVPAPWIGEICDG